MAESAQNRSIYFRSLEVKNVRCFGERQILELVNDEDRLAQWTLLLGDNGVGKTTLLECLAWMRPVPRKADDVSDTSKSEDASDLSKADDASDPVQIPLTNEENEVLKSLLRAGTETEVELDLRATLAIGGNLGEPAQAERDVRTSVRMRGRDGRLVSMDPKVKVDDSASLPSGELPVFVYGATRHMGHDNLERDHLADDSLVSRFSIPTELYDAEEILLDLDYLALKEGNRNKRSNERLAQIKRILASILPGVPNEKGIEILGPKPLRSSDSRGGVTFKTPYGTVPLSGLSLGYQTTLAWALDLAARLYRRYPESANPLAEPAVVLVDEIDLHLHPRWQREITADLAKHFPATQFIATAHSPVMAQSPVDAKLVVLRRDGDRVTINSRPQFVEGWRVDQILTSDLFGVAARSPAIERLIEERYDLLRKGEKTPLDKRRLRELDSRLNDLPVAIRPEDDEAMKLIRQAAELIGERKIPTADEDDNEIVKPLDT